MDDKEKVVYCVTKGEYEDYEIDSIFDSYDLANTRFKQLIREESELEYGRYFYFEVLEWVINKIETTTEENHKILKNNTGENDGD